MTFTYWWRELWLSETSYIRNSYYTAFSVFSPTLLHHTLFSSAVILLFFLLLLVQFGLCQQLQLSPPCDCCWMPFKGPCEELYVGAWRCQWVCIISPCDQTLWKWIKETVQVYQDFLSQSNALDLVDCKSAPHLLLIRAERERDRWDAEKERWQECLVWYACMGIFVFLYVTPYIQYGGIYCQHLAWPLGELPKHGLSCRWPDKRTACKERQLGIYWKVHSSCFGRG